MSKRRYYRSEFNPTIDELIISLLDDPKQFPKKQGALATARAAGLFRKGVAFRAVFTIDESKRMIDVLAIAPHDEAYALASRRI